MWNRIQENFKCSSASGLLLRVEDFMPKRAREYFLIGENRFDYFEIINNILSESMFFLYYVMFSCVFSEVVDQWIKELLKVLKTQTSENTVQVTDDSLQQVNQISIFSPPKDILNVFHYSCLLISIHLFTFFHNLD